MAVRAWIGPVATAIGVAAGTGAAQLGFGYGLGVITWMPSTDESGDASWVASLTWATWIAATATIVGALCAARLAGISAHRSDTASAADRSATTRSRPATVLQRITLALAAGVGALVTVALVAVPARAATRADTFSPQAIAAGYAAVGVLVGVLMAVWAFSSPAVARNLIATACWLWLLAAGVVTDVVASGHHLTGAQLGAWWTTGFGIHGYLPGALLSLGPALLIGVFAARRSARLAGARVGATISGGVGPLLVAIAHLLAAPHLVGTEPGQVWPHLMAPSAVIAGLAGSALVAAYAQRADHRVRPAGTTGTDHPDTGTTDPGQREGDDRKVPSPTATPRIPAQPIGGPDGEPTRTEPTTDTTEAPAKPRQAARSSRSTRRPG